MFSICNGLQVLSKIPKILRTVSFAEEHDNCRTNFIFTLVNLIFTHPRSKYFCHDIFPAHLFPSALSCINRRRGLLVHSEKDQIRLRRHCAHILQGPCEAQNVMLTFFKLKI